MYRTGTHPSRLGAVLGYVFCLIGGILLFQGFVWLMIGMANNFSTVHVILACALSGVGGIFLTVGIISCVKWKRNMRAFTQESIQTGQQGPTVVGYDPNQGTNSYPSTQGPTGYPPPQQFGGYPPSSQSYGSGQAPPYPQNNHGAPPPYEEPRKY